MTTIVTPSGQMKLTTEESIYLQSFLDARDRGGYYMALYNITKNEATFTEAQVSMFSQHGRAEE